MRTPTLPERRLSLLALWGAGLLCALCLGVGAGFVLLEKERIRQGATDEVVLHAKALEEQTSRTMTMADTVLRVIADIMNETGGEESARLSSLLHDSSRRQPLLRSVSVLDLDGRVLGSSQPDNIGAQVDMGLFEHSERPRTETRPGRLLAGRDVRDLRALRPGQPEAAYVLPMLRWVQGVRGQPLLMLALINIDYLANEQERMLSGGRSRAALLSYTEGQFLAGPTDLELGRSMSHLEVFTHFLPRNVEHSTYIGPGLGGQPSLIGFRALRNWPLVVVVEVPYDKLNLPLHHTMKQVGGVTLAICVFIIGMAGLLHSSLRREEQHGQHLRAVQAAARGLELRRRAVLESALDAIITFDGDGRVVDLNPAAEQIFGRSASQLLQGSLFDLLAPPHRTAYHDAWQRYPDDQGLLALNHCVEIDALRADGGAFPAEMTMVPMRSGDGLFFTMTLRDITRRRQVEAERDALLMRYRTLATDLERQKLALDEHAIVSITDAQGIIRYANAKLAEISGYAPGELIGSRHSLLKSGRQSRETYLALWDTITQGRIWHGELVNRRKNGRFYWVASTIVPVPGDDGRPREYISIQTDISALRQAEMALAEAHQRELDIGTRIQQSLLVTPPSQQVPGLWVSVFNQASQGIDGDFVEVFQLGEGCVDIVVGDVMGKGLSAALMGAATKLQFCRSMTELMATSSGTGAAWATPAQIVAAVHRAMTPHLQALEAFVTLCHVRLDMGRRCLSWVGCGHEEPLVLRQGQALRRLENQHPPLGVLDDDQYQQDELPLAEGDVLFLCSDGVTDAMRPDGERVGHERVHAALQTLVASCAPPSAMMQRLRRMLLHDGVQLNDDVTMLMAHMPVGGCDTERLELPPHVEQLHGVRAFVTEQCQTMGLDEGASDLLTLAAVEAFTNAVRHTVNRPADAPIELIARRDRLGVLMLEVVCLGDPFEPPAHLPETDLNAFPEGGFGLSIIRMACDSVSYLHAEGINTVRMVRHCRPAPHARGVEETV
jgi:PAS domain S-box-containing protein